MKTIIEKDYFIDGTKMDKKRLKALIRMGKKMDLGLSGMKMDKKNYEKHILKATST